MRDRSCQIHTLKGFKKFSLFSLILTLSYLAVCPPGTAQSLNLQHSSTQLAQAQPATTATSAQFVRQGTQISLNGRIIPIAWGQWQQGRGVVTGISDTGLTQAFGVELLNSNNHTQQPLRWFSASSQPIVAAARLAGTHRYLDINALARTAGWRLNVQGNTLQITAPPAQVRNLQVQNPIQPGVPQTQLSPQRLTVDLNRPASWQVNHTNTEAVITIDAPADAALVQRFSPPPPERSPNPILSLPLGLEIPSDAPPPPPPEAVLLSPIVESNQNQTTIKVKLPTGWRSRVSPLPNSNRLTIDIAPDAVPQYDITWAPGLRWRQQFVNLGTSRFPVMSLEVNLRQPKISLRPIVSNTDTIVGITPLVQMSRTAQASAAINAGFFNRNNQFPLGAIRSNNRWLSSPILNRGAIAWNDKGNIKMGNLAFEETLTTASGERLPISYLNSGYVQTGISRYTSEWGPAYIPVTDNELVVVVQNNRVNSVFPGGAVGATSFPLTKDSYVLAVRGRPELASLFTPGSTLRLQTQTTPADFAQYPHILGAGPLLMQNRQIILDGKAERFGDAFIQQAAIRSAIGTTASGNLILAAVHNRAGGNGPTLAELAQIMQQMGIVDALNLDGGSSTNLVLGGQLINRSPATAARVHNGLGIFVRP